jgi:hypothetical protein
MSIKLKAIERVIAFHKYFESTTFLVKEDERDRVYSTHGRK